jgi:hypothetical protein
MSAEQDARYFRLDFRRKTPKVSVADKQPDQYWEICKAIWPEYENKHHFEQLDMREFFRLSIPFPLLFRPFSLTSPSSRKQSGRHSLAVAALGSDGRSLAAVPEQRC